MALGSTQPLRETSTRNLPGGKGRPASEADNLTILRNGASFSRRGGVGLPVKTLCLLHRSFSTRISALSQRAGQLRGPLSILSIGYRGLFSRVGGIKWPGHEADHSHPSSAEIKNC
jgi:hypothetical protein